MAEDEIKTPPEADKAKADAAKPEAATAKADAAKPEAAAAKADAPKADAAKPEDAAAKAATAKPEAAAAKADKPAADAPKAASPKKSGNRTKIVVIVIAVIAVLGIGFSVWHNQPNFCSTVCHTPMSHTVDTYYSNDTQYGVTVHAQNNKACLDCHTANIGDQVNEGTKWLTGNYNYNSSTGQLFNTQNDLLVSYSDKFANAEFCLRSGCHTASDGSAITTEDQLKASTEGKSLNPHDFSYHGQVACGTCHKMHQQSVFVCTECHSEAQSVVPEGWVASSNKEASL